MFNEHGVLDAALRRAADMEHGTVSSLTQRILHDWLVSHAFLAPPSVASTGQASVTPDLDPQALRAKLRPAHGGS